MRRAQILAALLVFAAAPAYAQGGVDPWDTASARAQARVEEFYALIDARQVGDAMAILDPALLGTLADRLNWGRQFWSIRSIHVLDVEPWATGEWTETRQRFKVTLEAYVETQGNPAMPAYGWHDNPNIRWITTTRDAAGSWRIAEIATGP
ncbi:MAG: hypothetical protein CVT82_05975 [Alphaproteobacteria bacterium HGW-Alphaproteobacteria-4]|jgi:hypothetical protein|nr:MAG: hypothetical protein CVT82_05975 [Alphaproteobacteria bacterium HGW-Alphaproteobacteria-4]